MVRRMRRVRNPASNRWTTRRWQLKSRVITDIIQAIIEVGQVVIVSSTGGALLGGTLGVLWAAEAALLAIRRRGAGLTSEEQVEAVLAAIDPHGRGQMTFSDCVATLSNDLVALLPSE